jgi:hypothetical protein
MALLTLTGLSITEDETPLTQNSGVPILENGVVVEDNNDSDIALSNLSSIPFFNRLFDAGQLGLDQNAVIGLARSSGDIVTVDPNVTDVKFTDANGDPLDGDPSGLFTVAGNQIFLYTDTENNIVLLREGTGNTANPAGDVVAAIVMEETATGVKFWTVQFEAFGNTTDGLATDGATASVAGAHDDFLTLTDKLFVSADAPLIFNDFSKAPSGQNDWLGFGPSNDATVDTQILVTGHTPLEADNNQAGDTVNTSTIGIGTNKQSVTFGEGIRVDLVSGLNLPPQGGGTGDTKDIFGIDYDNHVETTGAGFQLVQIGGNPTNTVDVKITVVNTADEEGQDFVDPGLTNDSPANVSFVQVTNAAGNPLEESDGTPNNAGITITISGNTATITGLQEGWIVNFNAASFDRYLIENVTANAQANDAFDVGNFSFDQGASATEEVGSKVRMEDDGPTAAIAQQSTVVAIDETAGVDADADDTTAAGVVALFAGVTNVSTDMTAQYAQDAAAVVSTTGSGPGADGGGTTTLSLDVSSSGVDSGLDATDGTSIFLFKEGDLVVGRIGGSSGAAAFAIAMSSSGVVSMAQYASIKHPDSTNPDDAVSITDSALVAKVTQTDGDGDTDIATTGIGDAISFQDDGNSLTIADGFVDFSSGSSDTETLGEVNGQDGFGNHKITDFTDHPDLTETLSNNDTVLTYSDTLGDVFKLTLNNNGTYTFDVLADAPVVEVPLNFAAVSSGGPRETLSVPAGDTGVNIVFDGVLFTGAYPNFTDLNATDPDDLNPDDQGFGVKQGQASQINNNEGFFAIARDASNAEVEMFGLEFDIEGIGSTSSVNVSYTLLNNGSVIGGATTSVSLPSGNNAVHFDDIDSTTAFDSVFVRFFFDGNVTNKGVRLENFSTIIPGEFPDQTLSFEVTSTDGDGDTAVDTFDVDIDGNHDGMVA